MRERSGSQSHPVSPSNSILIRACLNFSGFLSVRLRIRVGSLEGRKLQECLLDPHNGGEAGQVYVEAACIVELGHESQISKRHLITHAVFARGFLHDLLIGYPILIVSDMFALKEGDPSPCRPRSMNLRAQSILRSSPTSFSTGRFCSGCVSAQMILTSCLTLARDTALLGRSAGSGLVSCRAPRLAACSQVDFIFS